MTTFDDVRRIALRLPEAVQNILLPAMDERQVVVPKMGTVKAEPGFLVVATQNPREFTATHALSEALLDRFEMLWLDYQSEEEELKILQDAQPGWKGKVTLERILEIVRATRKHQALKRGAITEAADNPERAIRGVAFVVLATPPAPARDLLGRMRPWLAEGAIVTDVASVKAPIMQAATAGGLADRFAGSHPLAGTHESGFDAATPTLLQRAVVYVCPSGTDAGDVIARAVAGFWRTVADAEPVVIDAVAHEVV